MHAAQYTTTPISRALKARPATPPADRVFERSERPCFTGSGAAPAGDRPHAKKENPGSVVGTCPSARWGVRPAQSAAGLRRHRDGLAAIHG